MMPSAGTAGTVDLVERVTQTARTVMLTFGVERNSCILACRVVADALAYYGVEAKPQAVHASAYAPATGMAYVTAGGNTRADLGGLWSGHLVLQAAGLLIDPSSDQMAREGLPVGLLVAPLPEPERTPWTFGSQAGVQVQYQPINDVSWRLAPAWQPDRTSRGLVVLTIRMLRAEDAAGRVTGADIETRLRALLDKAGYR